MTTTPEVEKQNALTDYSWLMRDWTVRPDTPAPLSGLPWLDRCDCCGRWIAPIVTMNTWGWRFCDRCANPEYWGDFAVEEVSK